MNRVWGRRCGKISWKLLAGLAVALVIVVPVAQLFFRYEDDYAAAKALPKAEAAYRTMGLPWTAADLVQPVPANENAAPYLNLAIAQVHGATGVDLTHPAKIPPSLHLLAPALRTALYASAKKGVDFQRNWSAGPNLLLPEYSDLRTICHAFCLRAELEASAADIRSCTRDLVAARRIAALIGHEPLFIAMLVQISCDDYLLVSAQRCAASMAGNTSDLKAIRAALATPVDRPDVARALRGEAFMQLAVARDPQYQSAFAIAQMNGSQPPTDGRSVIRETVPMDVRVKASMDRILEAWTRIGSVMRSHPKDLRAIGKATEQVAKDMAAHSSTSYMLASQIFPAFQDVGNTNLSNQALNAATDALLAGLIRRSETGAFPARIDQIPGKWVDPFSGAPLHLRLSGAPHPSLKIYSVGPNGKDDLGISQMEAGQRGTQDQNFDVVAEYPPLPHKL